MKMKKLALSLIVILGYGTTSAWATPILGSDLTNFAVLGATTVTNTGSTTLGGNVGVSPGTAITGLSSISFNNNGSAHQADATSDQAQLQLTSARTDLGLLGAGTTLSSNLTNLTLLPGIYTVPAGTSNLTGTLTLNGNGNSNAVWVFQMPSTLITSVDSVINVINSGAGASIYWNVGSSATLGTNSTFDGNILALTSITLDHAATIDNGRALANTGAVTMDANSVFPSSSVSAVPESATYVMFMAGLGMIGFMARNKSTTKK